MKNALKFLSMTVALGALIFTTSCGEDDGPTAAVDAESPSITINAPADGAIIVAGSQTASSIAIADDVEISTVSIKVGNGTVTVIDIAEADVADASFSFNSNLTIPADVVLGDHTLEVTVTDTDGKSSTQSITLTALPAYTDGQTTVMVASVPDEITDYSGENQIHMVGAHQGDETGAGAWDPTSGTHPLTSYVDSESTQTFYIQVANTGVEEFKMVRTTNGWDFVEKGSQGEEVDNRMVEANANYVTLDAIQTWKDYNPDVQDNSTVDVISGSGTTSIDIKGKVVLALTTQSALSSASYFVLDENEAEVASGSVTVASDGTYSENLSIDGYELGTYAIQVLATDAQGAVGRGDATLSLLEFPCDDSGLDAVAGSMTRVQINVNTSLGERDMYVTGKINGADVWGTVSNDYLMTKISDGCYYIDLVLQADDQMQFFYEEASHGADWWKGAATRVDGDGGTAAVNISEASSGNDVKAVFGFWRENPAN